jgi:hypothetical protein
MNRIFIFLSCALFASNVSNAADTLRCGGKLVETGMTMAQVETYCGQPDSSETQDQDVRAGNRVIGTTQMHLWTYDRASGQNAAVLEFDQDKLVSITFVRK